MATSARGDNIIGEIASPLAERLRIQLSGAEKPALNIHESAQT